MLIAVLSLVAASAPADVVELSDGSRLLGTVERWGDGKLILATQFAGTLEIDASLVVTIQTDQPVNVGIDQRMALPTKKQVYSSIEGTISHFELSMSNRGFEVPCEESYAAIEAPNGELGFYIAGDGNETAYRARCRPPSFIHFAMFPDLIRGHTLSDVVAVLGSLNIIAAELDR